MDGSGGQEAAQAPDYSSVDSRAKAEEMAAKGTLVPLLLLPEMFGGDARPENVVFVPPFVAELKQSTEVNVIVPLARAGKVRRYRAEPEYAGRSFVPIAIRLVASDPGDFRYNLRIWGEALDRE